ncbi:MAG TPA: restriction endonuclease subunit S [Pirellulales bacterium]|nr:restriction endonuclease subunit S [Pirellulales bacterium]
MIDALQPYAENKDSGQAWLGRVPGHWELRRLKSSVANVVEQTSETEVGDVYVALEHVESWTGRVRPITAGALFTGQVKRFAPGDVLFGKLRPYLAKVTRLPQRGVCVGEFFVLRTRSTELLQSYLEQLLRSKPAIDVVNGSTFGAKMPRADWQFVGSLRICIPPPDEQAAIVRFLCHANGRMDGAIRAKQKLIALLNEQKQAIIQCGVTRGLAPSVPLKTSDIPWLGEIPKHWEVLRSKYIFREVDERSATGEETHLSMSQRLGLIPRSAIEENRLVSQSYVGAKLCEKGDLVLNRLKAHLGVFALASQRGLVSPDYTVFRQTRAMEPHYFEAVYRTPACRVELRQRAKGIVQGFWRLYTDDFYNIRMPVPPVQEQEQIMTRLDLKLAGLNNAIRRSEREIGLLLEYRARLSSDVVTGNLDVRAAGSQLPPVAEVGCDSFDVEAFDPEDDAEVRVDDSGLVGSWPRPSNDL